MVLSGRFIQMLATSLQQRIETIQVDNTSGAVELATKGAEVFMLLAETSPNPKDDLRIAAVSLINAQPSMAPLFNLANQVLLYTENLEDEATLRHQIQITARQFTQSLQQSNTIIGSLVSEIIPDGGIVLTHSFSTTVYTALMETKNRGKQFTVICTESRPMLEGVMLAKKLGQAAIPVRLVLDAATFLWLPRADCILVGADAVTIAGVTNKIGTLGVALAARVWGKAMYCLCSSHKFLPANHPPTSRHQHASHEIITEIPENVTVDNDYFDTTPLEYFTAIVMEKAVLTADMVRDYLGDAAIHPVLVAPEQL
jgi:translation initiation factor eIF-2B subunit delta